MLPVVSNPVVIGAVVFGVSGSTFLLPVIGTILLPVLGTILLPGLLLPVIGAVLLLGLYVEEYVLVPSVLLQCTFGDH